MLIINTPPSSTSLVILIINTPPPSTSLVMLIISTPLNKVCQVTNPPSRNTIKIEITIKIMLSAEFSKLTIIFKINPVY